MTIKAKLIANMMVTVVIIAGISFASFSSMHFLQEKISYIAEKTTPFQMGTVELQRDLQSCITDLLKVNSAHTQEAYSGFRSEAEISLGNTGRSQKALELMSNGHRIDVSVELTRIANELFTATETRINSEKASIDANIKISQQMKVSSARLKELETNIRELQVTRAAAFAKALENTDKYSSELRNLEDLRNRIKDLISVSNTAYSPMNATTFLIIKGKIKTLLGRIAKSKSNNVNLSDIKDLTVDMNEFLELKSTATTVKDDDSIRLATESLNELSEFMNRLQLALSQEIELASAKLAIESHRQGVIFNQSSNANNILLHNSELVALGLTITGNINRLFTVTSPAELDSLVGEITPLFTIAFDRAQQVGKSLTQLDARNELKILQTAVSSLAAIRMELYSAKGILATLKDKLNAEKQALKSADKLHAMAIKQSVQGKESVAAAQVEQEKSITAVNHMVSENQSRILGIGAAALILGAIFGYWIYRSVLQPLGIVLAAVRSQREQGEEKASLAEAVADGDLSRDVIISVPLTLDNSHLNKDEMAMVLRAVVGMSVAQAALDRAFAKMTASLRNSRAEEKRRDRLKSGLNELNNILRIDQSLSRTAEAALAFIASFLDSCVGIIYLYDERTEILKPLSTYAISDSGRLGKEFRLGSGLPGQVAQERKTRMLASVPAGYLSVTSALGSADPSHMIIMPVIHNDTLIGILELGSFKKFSKDDLDFLNMAIEGIAIAIKVSRSRQLANDLLEQTQTQAEELRVQQEELQQTNEELMERSRMLTERQLH